MDEGDNLTRYYNNINNINNINIMIYKMTRKKQIRCLGCNLDTYGMVLGKSNPERTCAICLESTDVCYGCIRCISRNFPSCCTECYHDLMSR